MQVYLNNTLYSKENTFVYEVAEPILIGVKDSSSDNYYINGLPGQSRYIQFSQKGNHKIIIHSKNDETILDIKIVSKKKSKVRDWNNNHMQPNLSNGDFPFIYARHDIAKPESITFKIANQRISRMEKVSWNIGSQVFLGGPSITIDIKDFNEYGKSYSNIEVTAQIISTVTNKAISKKGRNTFVIYNEYEIDKQKGIVRPPVFYNEFVKPISKSINSNSHAYEVSMAIQNIEPENPIFITSKVIEYLNMDSVGRYSEIETCDIEIHPHELKRLNYTIPVSEIKEEDFGFVVHLKGIMGSSRRNSKKVFVSAYFEIIDKIISIAPNTNQPGTVSPMILNHILPLLHGVKSDEPVSIREISEKIKEDIIANPNVLDLQHTKDILNFVNNPNLYIKKSASSNSSFANNQIPCTEDQQGLTDTIGLEEYVCQLVPDGYDWVTVPARIVNAKKGDVILTPSGDTFVGKMMFSVYPPQYYSHCGIMTENYREVRHSTASEDWYVDNLTQDDDGVDANVDGIYADAIRYGWPGTVTQTVSDTYHGEIMTGKQLRHQGVFDYFSDKEYLIKGFSQYNSDYAKEPKVVKPDPFVEAADFITNRDKNVRTILRKIAESAKLIDGHYRFYCYTKADIFFDPQYEITSKAKDTFWVNQNGRNPTKPTVCSSMIWAAIKSISDEDLQIEGNLEPSETNSNSSVFVEIDSLTKDGLYLYSEAERARAAHSLYNQVTSMASQYIKDFGFFGDVANYFENIVLELGNQFCNTFTSDSCGPDSLYSTNWWNPKEGRAVSPDDILNNWDGVRQSGIKYGLYGFNERLLFREECLIRIPKYRWVKVGEKGIVRGIVLDDVGNPVPFVQVNYTNNTHVMTNDKGEFEIRDYACTYELVVYKEIGGIVLTSKEISVEVIGNEIIEGVIVSLHNPNKHRRDVRFEISAKIHDREVVGSHTGVHSIAFKNLYLDLQTPQKQIVKFQAELVEDNEVKGKYEISLTILSDSSVRVDYRVELWEKDCIDLGIWKSCSWDFKKMITGDFIVPKDATDYPYTHSRLSDDGDWIESTFIVHNLQYNGV